MRRRMVLDPTQGGDDVSDCKVCGKEFQPPKRRGRPAVVCSDACRAERYNSRRVSDVDEIAALKRRIVELEKMLEEA